MLIGDVVGLLVSKIKEKCISYTLIVHHEFLLELAIAC